VADRVTSGVTRSRNGGSQRVKRVYRGGKRLALGKGISGGGKVSKYQKYGVSYDPSSVEVSGATEARR
jgi:hypothetical protein